MDLIALIKDWLLPLGSVLISIWFAASAKRDADRADSLLKQINDAIQGWQSKLLSSTADILDSTPQVIEGKTSIEVARALVQHLSSIEKVATSNLPAEDKEKTLLALSAHLSYLIDKLPGGKG